MSKFFDEGAELHTTQPELLLCEVWIAAAMFILSHADALDFVEGYKAARRRRDEFIAEQRGDSCGNPTHPTRS